MAEKGLKLSWLFLLLMLCIILQADSAKVVLFPMNMGSHIIYFGQVASALAETGHEATLYVPSNNKPPQGLSSEVNVVIYKVPGEIPYTNSAEWAEVEIGLLKAESVLEWLQLGMEGQAKILEYWGADCEALFVPDVYGPLSSAGYDLAIMDPLNFPCLYALPYKLGIRYISLSVPFGLWSCRVPHFSSAYPNQNSGLGNKIDFGQRLSSFSLDWMEVVFLNRSDHYVKTFVSERPVVSGYELVFNSSMWWYLYDVAVDVPKASMPNTLDIGDIMVRPANPLPKDYLGIMQASEHGVILVSLGSHFDVVPDSWLQEFCKAFNQLKYTVIWKLKIKPPCNTAQNVHVRPWVPQNDLLAHPKLVLFITHCGYNSLLESSSHGKPMIGFPINLDQPKNAQLIKDKGLGEVLDLTTFTAGDLTATVERVVSDPKYRNKAQHISKLLRNKPQKPAERMSYWVNHLMEHGDSHLKSAATDLNVIQFLMIDIYLFLFCSGLVVIGLILSCMYCCCRCVKKLLRKGSRKEHQE